MTLLSFGMKVTVDGCAAASAVRRKQLLLAIFGQVKCARVGALA
jgi:hypothetical protein